jgi:hypothetical protein
MEVSLCICIVTCSVFSGLAQRIYGMSRNLNCTMIVLQFLYSFYSTKWSEERYVLPQGAIQCIARRK